MPKRLTDYRGWRTLQRMMRQGLRAPHSIRMELVFRIAREEYGLILPGSWQERLSYTALRLIAWLETEERREQKDADD